MTSNRCPPLHTEQITLKARRCGPKFTNPFSLSNWVCELWTTPSCFHKKYHLCVVVDTYLRPPGKKGGNCANAVYTPHYSVQRLRVGGRTVQVSPLASCDLRRRGSSGLLCDGRCGVAIALCSAAHPPPSQLQHARDSGKPPQELGAVRAQPGHGNIFWRLAASACGRFFFRYVLYYTPNFRAFRAFGPKARRILNSNNKQN